MRNCDDGMSSAVNQESEIQTWVGALEQAIDRAVGARHSLAARMESALCPPAPAPMPASTERPAVVEENLCPLAGQLRDLTRQVDMMTEQLEALTQRLAL